MSLPEPRVVAVADADPISVGGGRLARLISRDSAGADFLLGVSWLPAGESMEFDLRDWQAVDGVEPQEGYFVLSGAIRVAWDGGELEASAWEAVFFPPARAYTVTATGDGEAAWAYLVVPPPR